MDGNWIDLREGNWSYHEYVKDSRSPVDTISPEVSSVTNSAYHIGKLFKIQDGSYVSWNGDIADPQMSITAVETVRTTISEEEKNTRQVNFDISIIIKNSLENLSVSFDLSAPEDLTLQNQLTSLTAEQRASQAMSLLIYNTYTGPGTSTTKRASQTMENLLIYNIPVR